MDVNSNSHAEQSRADSHAKDTRPGATVSPKEKKVTWQSHSATRAERPSFLADANRSCACPSVPSPFLSPLKRQWSETPLCIYFRDSWLRFSEQMHCFRAQRSIVCAELRHYLHKLKNIHLSRLSRITFTDKKRNINQVCSTFSHFSPISWTKASILKIGESRRFQEGSSGRSCTPEAVHRWMLMETHTCVCTHV